MTGIAGLFSFTGRINRLDFFLRSLSLWPWGMPWQFMHPHKMNISINDQNFSMPEDMGSMHVEGPWGMIDMNQVHTMMAPYMVGLYAVHAVLALGIIWFYCASQAKRLHDMNASGWFVMLNLIPGAHIVLWFVTVFASGTMGDNKYGSDPMAGRR